uniref:Uncharacterized protein n=2 Tax=Brassica oleracea TaxID=3712 RepID=A0A0D3ADX7_BRAOL|nr:unnamed protein product [Brassica oleracea]
METKFRDIAEKINIRHNWEIWDTVGKEMLLRLGVAFYTAADCCVLVYDVNYLKSFDSIEVQIVVAGVEKKARQWCAHKGNICYYETTAKEDYNVDELF